MIKWIKDKIIWFLFGSIALASTVAIIPEKPIVLEQPIVIKTITEKIKDDGIEKVLKDKTQKEKVEIKSKELSKVKIKDKFTKKGIEIEIIGDIKEIEGGIELFAKAWVGNNDIQVKRYRETGNFNLDGLPETEQYIETIEKNTQLGFGKDGTIEIERFRFFNPPVLVDDESGDIIREWTDDITKEVKQRKLKYDPTEAIRQSLAHTISLVGKSGENIIKGKVGNTTSTFYPAAGANSPVDGMARRIATETFSTLRTGAGTFGTDTLNPVTTARISTTATADQFEAITRGIFLFDTAVIDSDTIDSAIISFYPDAKGSGLATVFNVSSSNPASNAAVVASDYDVTDFGSTNLSTGISISSISTGVYNNFSLNSSGLSNINKTSISKFALRTEADITNISPTWVASQNSYLSCYHADEAGTDKDPKLVVEHSEAVSRRIILIE